MTTITIHTVRDLKKFVAENRQQMTNINGIELGKIYPILEVTNTRASYYSPADQMDKTINKPFTITIK